MTAAGPPDGFPAGPPDGSPAGPPDGRQVPRFAGPDTFARLPRLADVGSAAVADVVEFSPPYDHAELTALAAANVGYEMLSLFALRPPGGPG